MEQKIRKAFKLTVNNLIVDEPWHYENIIVYANTHGEAKTKGIYEFQLGQVEDYTQKNYKGEYLRDIVFTDVRARREKSEDQFFYKDRWRTRKDLQELEWQDKRDEEAKQLWIDNPDGIAVVYNGSYNTYWGANHAGYWSKIEDAGKYSTKEAYDIVRGSSFDRQETVILLNKEQYNAELKEKANKLLSSII